MAPRQQQGLLPQLDEAQRHRSELCLSCVRLENVSTHFTTARHGIPSQSSPMLNYAIEVQTLNKYVNVCSARNPFQDGGVMSRSHLILQAAEGRPRLATASSQNIRDRCSHFVVSEQPLFRRLRYCMSVCLHGPNADRVLARSSVTEDQWGVDHSVVLQCLQSPYKFVNIC